MNQLFISYSRKDTEFARRLTESFAAQNMEAWVDWQDIPPSVDWFKEIEKGIEETDVFIFIISPDSVQSKVCAEEVAHAIKNGKRIAPVVCRDIDMGEAPDTVKHLNWIFARTQDDFQVSFDKLLSAIRTDYDWVQVHSRLQIKALEWDRNKREESFLLRGMELQDAEAQLSVNGQKAPIPTELQRIYISTSRQTEDKYIEEDLAEKQQLKLEQAMRLRLRRVTFLVLTVFTIAFFALYLWLNRITTDLAVNSIKNQMLALVETSVSVIDGNEYASFASSYSDPAANAVYGNDYYQMLSSYVENIKTRNENISADFALYTIVKGENPGEFSVLVSSMEDMPFRFLISGESPTGIHAVGMNKTIADPATIYQNDSGDWVCSCAPIFNSKGESVGALCADFDASLVEETRRRVRTILTITFLAIYPFMIALTIMATRSVQKSGIKAMVAAQTSP
jgi:hypothetical protein